MRKIYAGTSTAVKGSKLASATRLIALALVLCLTGYTGWAAPNTVCQGQTITLTSGGPGGYWVSNNSSIAKVGPQTGIVTGVNAGNAVIYYRLPTGVILTNSITVLPLYQSSGVAALCQGTTAILVNKTAAGGTWSTNSNAISTISANGMLTGVGEGTAIVTFTSTMGCVATKSVTVFGIQPVTGFNAVCVGQTTTLANSLPGGRWFSSSGAIALVSQTGVVKGVHDGMARISYITPQGCHSVSSVTVMALNSTTTLGTSYMCQGEVVKLANSTPFGGTWTSSAPAVATINTTTGELTGLSGGATTVSFTTATGGCVTVKQMSVTPISPILGTLSVCVGQSTMLSNAMPGGRWSTGSDALSVFVSQAGQLTGRHAIEGTRIYYIWPSGCQSEATVTVRPLEAIKTKHATPNFCMNMSYQLTNATVGTGTWTSSNNGIAPVSSTGMVTGLSAGAAIITYATDRACITTMSVNVIQVQPITGITSTCVGQTTTLANAAAPVGRWSTGTDAIARVTQAGVVTGVSAGSVNVSFINPAGCHSVASVLVHALSPNTGQGSTCRNGVFTLRNSTPFGGIWSSSNPGVAAINPTTGLVTTGNTLGIAVMSFTAAASGCIATSTVRVVNCFRESGGASDPMTEVAEEVAAIQLYPNPNNGSFTLKGSIGSMATAGGDEQATVEIMNMLGQVISTSAITVHDTNVDAPIALSNMPAGTYILNMRTANGSKQFRFVLQH